MSNSKSLMSLGDLFSKSFEVYKERFWVLVGLTAINFAVIFSFLFLFLVFFVTSAVLGLSVFTSTGFKFSIPIFVFGLILFLIGAIVAIVVGTLVQVSSLIAVKENPK